MKILLIALLLCCSVVWAQETQQRELMVVVYQYDSEHFDVQYNTKTHTHIASMNYQTLPEVLREIAKDIEKDEPLTTK